jgi:hypothetical protein
MSDRIPEPRWLQGDPTAFADEPPENFLPDDERRSLESLIEFLEGELEEVKGQLSTGELPSSLTDPTYKAYEAWKAATEKLMREVEALWDETVGEDWDEPDF